MKNTSHLVFGLHRSHYAVDAMIVNEIFSLPEITPIEEVPEYIIGVVNLRGRIVPVMDLEIRLGRIPHRYQLSDKVIVLHLEEYAMDIGIIVNQVYDVQDITREMIEAAPFSSKKKDKRPHIISREAKLGDQIIMLINPLHLLSQPEMLEEAISDDEFGTAENGNGYQALARHQEFCPDATPEEREVFLERARNLRFAIQEEETTGQTPVAVIGISNEFFGIPLDAVGEFAEIDDVTPIPCCPNYIVGNINLRGDILTLLDIRTMLKLPVIPFKDNKKVMVVNVQDLRVGVVVDDVFDVIYLAAHDIKTIPAALKTSDEEFVVGTAKYESNILSIIDLKKMIQRDEIYIEEEV